MQFDCLRDRDSQYTHYAWRQTAPGKGGIGEIGYPLVADLDKNIAREYGVLLDESVALRSLFVIDTHGIVHHQLVNDIPLGRSVDGEIWRMLRSKLSDLSSLLPRPRSGDRGYIVASS